MLPRLNILISYAFLRKSKTYVDFMLAMSPYADILIDSGAFTNYWENIKARKEGRAPNPITIDEYIAFCQGIHGKVWQYIALDVIQNVEASDANLRAMVDAGLQPVPVFVYPESYKKLPELVAVNERICVAGGVDAKRSFMHQRFQKAYKASGGKAKIHGLGFVKHPDMFQLPLASVDSSSWMAGGRYGHIPMYSPRNGVQSVSWKKLQTSPAHVAMLRDANVSAAQASDPQSYRTMNSIPTIFSVYAHLQMHRHCYAENLRYFLATSNTSWVHAITATLSAIDNRTNKLDYQIATANFQRYLKLVGQNPTAYINWMTSVLKEKTEWQQRLP